MSVDDKKPPEHKIVIILDGNKIVYAAFANPFQEAQIIKALQNNTLPQ